MLTVIVRNIDRERLASKNLKGSSVIANGKTLATIKSGEAETIFLIHPQLEMEEYEILRETILEMVSGTNAGVDESGCKLGYLENGEPAYLIKNWEPWKAFLMRARLRTLEGQNIAVKDSSGDELGSGLLAEYKIEQNPFRITSCTLITIFGEKKIEGAELQVEPTGRFN
ncbi:hypothetical protein [Mesobacillus foraminis]|uniref:hypothetical protein n=1 Tax=Mesobacillus foraminis TaxID=279826 RepID=UPI000EF47C0F|nr:hypothetical protein [Mesobacillus foraminis]